MQDEIESELEKQFDEWEKALETFRIANALRSEKEAFKLPEKEFERFRQLLKVNPLIDRVVL